MSARTPWRKVLVGGDSGWTRKLRGCIANVYSGSWQVFTLDGQEILGEAPTSTQAKREATFALRSCVRMQR